MSHHLDHAMLTRFVSYEEIPDASHMVIDEDPASFARRCADFFNDHR